MLYTLQIFAQDLRREVAKVAKFLNKPLSEEKLARLLEHLKFENISKNESVNLENGKKMGFMNQDGHFIRRGNMANNFINTFFKVQNLY